RCPSIPWLEMRTPTLIGGAALTTISYSCLLYPFSRVAFFHVSGCPQLRRSAWLAEADAVSNQAISDSGTQQLIPWPRSEAGNVIPLGRSSTRHDPAGRRNT